MHALFAFVQFRWMDPGLTDGSIVSESEHGRRRRTCHRVGPKCLARDMKSDDEDNAEKGQARGAPDWNFLPHELLLKIFRFLPPDQLMQASQVNC